MIIFIFTGWRRRTHLDIASWPEVRTPVEVWSYTKLLRKRRLPRATYIFGDFDRLGVWELELAARVFRQLEAGGARVLNDPARALQRHALLRALHRAGKNSFKVWLVETEGLPDSFPVFVRTASSHRGAMSDLLHDAASVHEAVNGLIASGIPSKDILAVEFRAEPVGDVYRKLAAHRVGPHVLLSVSVHDPRWMAKHGKKGVAGAGLYAEDLARVAQNRFAAELREVFDIARIDYGRADFGVVGGRVEVYEINTNPTMRRVREHPFPDRIAADRIWGERFAAALADIAQAPEGYPDGHIAIDDPTLAAQRRRDFWVLKDRFVL